MKATEKQIQFIAALRSRAIERNIPALVSGPADAGRKAAITALVLALPAPASAGEASRQIDCLKSLSPAGFQALLPQAGEILGRLAQSFGADGSGVPTRRPDGFQHTTATWVAVIRQAAGL